jgi:hypothetical protein
MNAVMAHYEVVVTNPTAQEAAGATIGRQTHLWIPLLSVTFATGSRMAVEMAPVWNLRDELAVKVLRRESPFGFVTDYSKSDNCAIGLIWSAPCL